VNINYSIGGREIVKTSKTGIFKFRKQLLYTIVGITTLSFALAGILFEGSQKISSDAVESNLKIHKKIQEKIDYLKSNPKDAAALKRLGALYKEAGLLKEAVSAYVSASRELPGDKEIQRAFIDLRARGHVSSN
jgi:hypothetical protein